ncbi:MAG TPA: TOBE domain-containing protein [Bacteroidales bacterium]|nr:TOBE domain-containing protein [Bacteroidales bacterium]
MNKLTGIVTQIQQSGAILLVDVDVDNHRFSALLIESSDKPEWLQQGRMVNLVFKETEVSLARNLSGLISMRNRMKCIVHKVERGELLSKITLQFLNHIITSAITTRAVDSLQITSGDEIEALVKANEISLMKI